MSERDGFLKPSKHIDSMDSRIIEKAKDLAGREKDLLSIVEIFFVYVRNNVSYYNSSEVSVSTATETLVSGSGDSARFIDNEGVVIPQKDIEGKDNFTVIKESPIFEDIPAEWESTLINNKNKLL